MKMRLMKNASYAIVLLASMDSPAFELMTHGLVTDQAFSQSRLGQSSNLLAQLGLIDLEAPFGSNYYDFTSAAINRRAANAYEAQNMPLKGAGKSLRETQ